MPEVVQLDGAPLLPRERKALMSFLDACCESCYYGGAMDKDDEDRLSKAAFRRVYQWVAYGKAPDEIRFANEAVDLWHLAREMATDTEDEALVDLVDAALAAGRGWKPVKDFS